RPGRGGLAAVRAGGGGRAARGEKAPPVGRPPRAGGGGAAGAPPPPPPPPRLYRALRAPASDAGDRRELLAAFRKQRLEPLRPHLEGVKRLFVVPTGPMAYVPADLIADGFAVSYVPSGSMLARTAENHRARDGSSLLALGA